MIINKNGSFRYIFGSKKTVVGFINTNYLISMKHIGYYWYTNIMKWNPHVPKKFLILFFKRKKFDNPKVQISSKPDTTFSIHPNHEDFRNLGSSAWAKWQTSLSFYSQLKRSDLFNTAKLISDHVATYSKLKCHENFEKWVLGNFRLNIFRVIITK